MMELQAAMMEVVESPSPTWMWCSGHDLAEGS